MKLIDKAAVVAEIDSMLKSVEHTSHCDEISFNSGRWKALTSIKDFIDTIELKEADFEKIWKEYFKYRGDVATVNVKHLAKHFFELGVSINHPTTASDKGMAEGYGQLGQQKSAFRSP